MEYFNNCVVCSKDLNEDGSTMAGVCDDCQYIINQYFHHGILQNFINKNKEQLAKWMKLQLLWYDNCCRCKYHSISPDDESCERKENKCPYGLEGIPQMDKERPKL
jgi:hypothetical protein